MAFTWNIKTLEVATRSANMLSARLADLKPSGWALDENEFPTEPDGLTEGWITFETDVRAATASSASQGRAI